MTWGFIWLMLVLKIPIAALLYLVWWAIHSDGQPEIEGNDEDGGTKVPPPEHRRPRPRRPRPRGPHGTPAPPSPPRVRTVVRSRDGDREPT
jgi:hypothetical protein